MAFLHLADETWINYVSLANFPVLTCAGSAKDSTSLFKVLSEES